MLIVLWKLLEIYQWLLIARVVLTWFPDFCDYIWYRWIAAITDPYLNLFRGWIPLIGGTIDVSPMIAFFVLHWIQSNLAQLLIGF